MNEIVNWPQAFMMVGIAFAIALVFIVYLYLMLK